MKKKLNAIIFVLWVAFGSSQTTVGKDAGKSNTEDTTRISKPPYIIDGFSIDPKKKTVSNYTEVGGKDWDGFTYVVNPNIHYSSTSLIILGSQITFKELFPFKGDMNAIRVIDHIDKLTTFKDENAIYYFTAPNSITKIDIQGYKAINKDIYQDKRGYLYFIGYGKLEKLIGLTHFDTKTLKHLVGKYYTDKNGLYFLDKYYHPDINISLLEAIKVEDSQGMAVEPIVTPRYFIYNNHVYDLIGGIHRLRLDAKKLIEIKWSESYGGDDYSITDGKTSYERHGYSSYSDSGKTDGTILTNTINYFSKYNIELQQAISPDVSFIQTDSNTLYLPLGILTDNENFSRKKNGSLLKTSDGFYFLNMVNFRPAKSPDGPQKIKKILVYNIGTREDEKFDLKEFKYFGNGICVYKDHLFLSNLPVGEPIDLKNLKLISNNYLITNYLTDGKLLIYASPNGGYRTKTVNGREEIILDQRIIKGVDVSKIKIVNKDRLIDDHYLYDGITVIPIQKLGLDVREYFEE